MSRSIATRPREAVPRARRDRGRLGLAVLLALLGVGALLVVALGPLGAGAIDYHVSSGATEQVRGGDLAAMLLVAPVSLVASWLTVHARSGASALALAPAAYGLYTYSQLALGGDLERYGGNSERWFLLFSGLVTLSGAVLILAGRRLAAEPVTPARPVVERMAGWYLIVVAIFLTVGLHLPGLADAWSEQPTSAEYLADPVVFWVVKLMDLGYVVPLLVAVGIAVLRRRPWGRRLLAPCVGWAALLACSVAGMAALMLATDAPGASIALASGFTLAAAGALWLAAAVYRPVLNSPTPAANTGPRPDPARAIS